MAQPPIDPISLSEQAYSSTFGQKAAEGANLDELLAEATQEIATGLGVSHAKVLEYLPDEKKLLVKAGVGWAEGIVGRARLGIDLESPAGFALQTGKPVIANDLDAEERFRVPALLANHGVKSAANVIIKTGTYVYGVLEADSFEQQRFGPADTTYLQGYANILAMAIRQVHLTRENFELNRRLEAMLHELSHRTKNNNQILLSLIYLQKSRTTSLEAREQLEIVHNRLMILNELDKLILETKSTERVDLGKYLISIIHKIFSIDDDTFAKVKLETEVARFEVDTRTAQALAMAVNEFLTNSFKYAFPRGAQNLTVSIGMADGRGRLIVADDGPGMPADAKKGVGLQLIEAMARQISGEVQWDLTNGTRLTILFDL